jgi:hypothetical protein
VAQARGTSMEILMTIFSEMIWLFLFLAFGWFTQQSV